MNRDLQALLDAALDAARRAGSIEALEAARVRFAGSKGLVKAALARIKEQPAGERAAYGRDANAVRDGVEAAFAERKAALAGAAPAEAGPWIDWTLPGVTPRVGRAHPLTQTIRDIAEIFSHLGFSVARGPEVEDEFHNFDALNIPPGHVARDPDNNFTLKNGQLLRSQTSTIQIRAMQRRRPPLRVLGPGRVYRPDTVDATHHFMFHQIEGLMVDEGVTFVDLKAVLALFLTEYFGKAVRFRLRPHYFPFTEPSAELDVLWSKAGGAVGRAQEAPAGARWLEMLGCGMVHPKVFEAVGIDAEQYRGFAFGMGVERLTMLRHGIGDIRHFHVNDARFLRQF
ncbi:MAG: phenylalanine--tRNA ligase subunit alpha [Planctomycetes bacterium]|nr:phenylalanine--tRNA ligase subunit alpha [Planctomycetota bacterium]